MQRRLKSGDGQIFDAEMPRKARQGRALRFLERLKKEI
jgi:hypothetical protein